MVKKDTYEEYKNSLLNIARLTHKDNSILINFEVVGTTCYNRVYYIQRDGSKDLLKEEVFNVDEMFYQEFLEKFINEYYGNMDIAFSDNINMNEDDLYTYRVVTEDNDMLSVDGISLEYAKSLMKLVNIDSNNNVLENEKALATWNITAILICGISLSFMILSLILG